MSNIENAVKFGIEEAPKHQYNPLVTYWDFDRWSIKAYAEVIINLTDGYNQIYGEPTTVIDSTLSGLGSDYFASRIIVYKNKRTIVYFDRLVHYIIPFDAISSCQPLDLSQQKISGGGFERKSVTQVSDLEIKPFLHRP